jgi:hypothetical protein
VAFANLEGTGLCGMRVAVGLCEKLDTRVRGVSVPTQQEGRWPPLQANPSTLKEREVTGKARTPGQSGLFEAHIQKARMDPTDAKLPLKWRSALPMGLRKSKHDTWVSTGNQGNHEFVVNVLRELLCTRAGRWECAHAVGDRVVCGLPQVMDGALDELDHTIWEEVLVAAKPEGLLSIEYKRLVNELEGKRAELDLAYMEAYANWQNGGSAPEQVPPTPHVIMLCSLLEEGFGWMHPFYLVMVMREWFNRVMKCEPPNEVGLALAKTHFGIELYNDDLIAEQTAHVLTWVSLLNPQGLQHLDLVERGDFTLQMKAMYHQRVPHTDNSLSPYSSWCNCEECSMQETTECGESLGSAIFYGGHCWVRCDVTTVTAGDGHKRTGCWACSYPVSIPCCKAAGYPDHISMPRMDTSLVIAPQGPTIAHSVTATSVRPPVMLPDWNRLRVLGNFSQTPDGNGRWNGNGIDPHGSFTFWRGEEIWEREERRNYTTFGKGSERAPPPPPPQPSGDLGCTLDLD